jgi:hypothetical protein
LDTLGNFSGRKLINRVTRYYLVPFAIHLDVEAGRPTGTIKNLQSEVIRCQVKHPDIFF